MNTKATLSIEYTDDYRVPSPRTTYIVEMAGVGQSESDLAELEDVMTSFASHFDGWAGDGVRVFVGHPDDIFYDRWDLKSREEKIEFVTNQAANLDLLVGVPREEAVRLPLIPDDLVGEVYKDAVENEKIARGFYDKYFGEPAEASRWTESD